MKPLKDDFDVIKWQLSTCIKISGLNDVCIKTAYKYLCRTNSTWTHNVCVNTEVISQNSMNLCQTQTYFNC